jgi:hypothetical protein
VQKQNRSLGVGVFEQPIKRGQVPHHIWGEKKRKEKRKGERKWCKPYLE